MNLPRILSILLLVYVTYECIRLLFGWLLTRRLSKQTLPFFRESPELPYSFLLLGDSTVYGVGASDPTRSLAGKIAAAFPEHNILNRGIIALSLGDLPTVIGTVSSGQTRKFDAVFILIGGIDILRLTPLSTIRKNLLSSIAAAKKLSPNIFLASSSNIRSAPFFRFPADRCFERQHRAVEELYARVSATEHITHIPLFTEFPHCPFARNHKKLYAQDGLHPNDAGYSVWFEKIYPFLKRET
jgi:lysophospholipase L1-like esterase